MNNQVEGSGFDPMEIEYANNLVELYGAIENNQINNPIQCAIADVTNTLEPLKFQLEQFVKHPDSKFFVGCIKVQVLFYQNVMICLLKQ